jgi:hypothetical protein
MGDGSIASHWMALRSVDEGIRGFTHSCETSWLVVCGWRCCCWKIPRGRRRREKKEVEEFGVVFLCEEESGLSRTNDSRALTWVVVGQSRSLVVT